MQTTRCYSFINVGEKHSTSKQNSCGDRVHLPGFYLQRLSNLCCKQTGLEIFPSEK